MNTYAAMSTKNIQSRAKVPSSVTEKADDADQLNDSGTGRNAKPGSMMAKANLVREYNQRNNSSKEDK